MTCLPVVIRKDTIDLFTKYKVYSEKELNSRFNILAEAYVKAVNIEGQTALMMAKTFILPAALRFQKELGESVAAAKAAGAASPGRGRTALHRCQFDLRFHPAASVRSTRPYHHDGHGDAFAHAKHMREAVLPAMAEHAQDRRQAGDDGPRRSLAAADVSRDAVHQVNRLDAFEL